MDKKIYLGNWKSHKTTGEVVAFFQEFKDRCHEVNFENKEVILAPTFLFLALCKDLIIKHSLPIKLAAQNVSSFPEGAYMGEVNAKQLKEFCEYVIVGHSERRKYMHENEVDIENKIRESKDQGLFVIQCIQDENSMIYKDADVIAFEPPNAISTFGVGEADPPEDIERVFTSVADRLNGRRILYGGSVDKTNIATYASINSCGGFLIGGASLEALSFLSLLNG